MYFRYLSTTGEISISYLFGCFLIVNIVSSNCPHSKYGFLAQAVPPLMDSRI